MIDNVLVFVMMLCAGVATTCALHGYFVDRPRPRVYAFGVSYATYAIAIAIGFLVNGCGATPQQTARHLVDGAGIAVDLTDQVFATQYTARARAALDASHSMEEYRTAVAGIDAVARGLEVARRSVELGDAAVRAWDASGAAGWDHAYACIVGALVSLRNLLVAAGVSVPPELGAMVDGIHATVDTDSCFAEGA